ncbi:acyltransferase [Rhodanobacter glycinis]|uniref:acyltransferase family protein n=1 Tax=Rhodanobacter glycinis TaxID=582702 RepID=UPI00112EECFD|nr:acyltransferase [Rhodanobacter glycinis]TPG50201.1 acyltransferase [Rhodanobacter glycinis]
MQEINRRYPNFDLMRLLLAAEVVFVHAAYYINNAFAWAGFIMAVPAFLAISGFLVLKSYEESGSWSFFLKKRGLRLLPALAVSMVLCFLLFDAFAVKNSLLNYLSGGIYTLEGAANAPLWSLAWEELAYFCLALLWMAGAYRNRISIWLLLLASMIVVHGGRHLPGHVQIILFLGPAFFIGNLMYLYRDVLLRVHPVIPWVLFLAVCFNAYIPGVHGIVDIYPLVFQSFSIVWVGMAGFRAIPFKFPDISYGLYIYHFPLVLFIVRHNLATTYVGMATYLIPPLVMICVASWYLIEKPALRLKNVPLRPYARRVLAVIN